MIWVRPNGVAGQGDGQNRPELPRHRHEAERICQWRKRQICPDGHDDDSDVVIVSCQARPRLDERDLVGADHMDDQRLGHDGFHKPAQCETSAAEYVLSRVRDQFTRSARRSTRRRCQPDVIALETKPQQRRKTWCNRRLVRTDRSDEHTMNRCDFADLPRARLLDILRAPHCPWGSRTWEKS